VDLTKAMPSRISQELLDTVVTHPPLDMEILPRKIPVPPDMPALPGGDIADQPDFIKVQNYHLDNYGHMNNARYVDIASAYIPDDFRLKRMRMEYKKMALPGDLILPRLGRGKGGSLVITLNAPDNAACEAGAVYAVMEFLDE
jgi:acyl-ACP thioesterase